MGATALMELRRIRAATKRQVKPIAINVVIDDIE
jgi:hypothetical protein